MKRLISVLRRPQVMLAIVSQRRAPFSEDALAVPDPYTETIQPLSLVGEDICPWKKKDVRAWQALSRVPNLSRRCSLAILRALIASVTDPDEVVPEPGALSFEHPPVDLRPHLCAPEAELALTASVAKAATEATAELDFPDWHWNRRAELHQLPAEFRKHMLWGLHLSPWPVVESTLAAYRELELEDDAALLRAVSRLLSLAARDTGLWWCEVLVESPTASRVRAAELILESHAYRKRPEPESRRALIAADWPGATRALLRGTDSTF